MRFLVGLVVGGLAGVAAARFLRPQTTPPAALKAPSTGAGSEPVGPARIDVSGAPPDPA